MVVANSKELNDAKKAETKEREITPLSPEGVRLIKQRVKLVWDRVQHTKSLDQKGLAAALGLSQSAVSKLLRNENSHPWTGKYLRIFGAYTGQSIRSLVPDELIGFYDDFEDVNISDESFLQECVEAFTRFYRDRGRAVAQEDIAVLAGKLCARLEGTYPSRAEMDNAMQDLVLEVALGSKG